PSRQGQRANPEGGIARHPMSRIQESAAENPIRVAAKIPRALAPALEPALRAVERQPARSTRWSVFSLWTSGCDDQRQPNWQRESRGSGEIDKGRPARLPFGCIPNTLLAQCDWGTGHAFS